MNDDHSKQPVEFETLDGSWILYREKLQNLWEIPIYMTYGNQKYILNFNENFKIEDSQVSKLDPNEETLEQYCWSIGIPKTWADLLSEFLHKTYKTLPSTTFKQDFLETSILRQLTNFWDYSENQFGTNSSLELRSILDSKLE